MIITIAWPQKAAGKKKKKKKKRKKRKRSKLTKSIKTTVIAISLLGSERHFVFLSFSLHAMQPETVLSCYMYTPSLIGHQPRIFLTTRFANLEEVPAASEFFVLVKMRSRNVFHDADLFDSKLTFRSLFLRERKQQSVTKLEGPFQHSCFSVFTAGAGIHGVGRPTINKTMARPLKSIGGNMQ